MTLERPSTDSPFGNIALCLSGGGYRAAAYALGSIDMLELLGLLDNVKLISTVSGGTFTGVTYSLSVADGKPYGRYFDDLRSFLRDTNCIELALNDLYKTPSPSGRKDLSLIRSAAALYDTRLLPNPGRTFDSLQAIVGPNKRFLELIHNATEFKKGNSFRFRASQNPNVFAGNGDFKVTPAIASRIRLADVIAASSCFPGVFEPIRFPDDFVWAGGVESIRQQLMEPVDTPVGKRPSGFNLRRNCLSLPLMDGGIYDNQGISNAVEADRTVVDKNVPIIDLFLICDTSARDDDMLKYPKPDDRAGLLSLGKLFWAVVLLFLFSVASLGFLIYYLVTAVDTRSLSWLRFIFQYLSPIALFVVLIGLLLWGYRLFRKNRNVVVSGAEFRLWPVVKRLTIPDLINMVKARVTSLGTMAGDVFMKRIRQLQFNDVMASSRGGKVSFDLIYDLNPSKDRSDLWLLDPDLKPTAEMKDISACAEAVPTTLWFPKKGGDDIRVNKDPDVARCMAAHPDNERLLLACAQCTTCFSLLKYLWRRWQAAAKANPATPKPNDPASPYYPIYVRLKAVWDQLKLDPYGKVDRRRT